MADEGHSQKRMYRRQCSVEDPERTHVQKETMERLAMQQRRRGPRTKTEATRQNRNKRPRRNTANASSDRTAVIWDRREALQIAIREANSRIIDAVTENEEVDLVEGSTTAKMEDAADKEGAGLVESPAAKLGQRERRIFK
jgi:hypothetical protein